MGKTCLPVAYSLYFPGKRAASPAGVLLPDNCSTGLSDLFNFHKFQVTGIRDFRFPFIKFEAIAGNLFNRISSFRN